MFQICREDYVNPVVLSCVCRQWRQIAVDCSALWRNIDVDRHDQAQLYLTRAKDADLDVFFNIYQEEIHQHRDPLPQDVDDSWVWKYGKRIARLTGIDQATAAEPARISTRRISSVP